MHRILTSSVRSGLPPLRRAFSQPAPSPQPAPQPPADPLAAPTAAVHPVNVPAVAAELAALAQSRYYDDERANLWMRGRRRELGGKSPNIFFPSIADADDAYFDKAIEGAVLFAVNQGEVCTCPSRILVHESIYEKFMSRVVERTNAIKMGNPLDMNTMMGAQASNDQYEKIKSYLNIGREEGAEVLCGGDVKKLDGDLSGGY